MVLCTVKQGKVLQLGVQPDSIVYCVYDQIYSLLSLHFKSFPSGYMEVCSEITEARKIYSVDTEGDKLLQSSVTSTRQDSRAGTTQHKSERSPHLALHANMSYLGPLELGGALDPCRRCRAWG